MNIGDFFERLSYEELSNTAIGQNGAGEIEPREHDRLTSHLNAALTDLYARFAHRVDYVTIRTIPGQRSYQLTPKHALSNIDPVNAAPRYIIDTPEAPFTHGLVKIIEIRREDDPATVKNEAEVLGVNRRRSMSGVQITSYDTFRLAQAPGTEILTVEYRPRHRALSTPTDLSQEIEIASVLETALRLNVAERVFAAMGGEGNDAKAAQLLARYEQACAIVEAEDLMQESGSDDHDKLRAAGFV